MKTPAPRRNGPARTAFALRPRPDTALKAKGFPLMIEWILILLAIAAIAAVFGFGRLAGVALTGAKILIIVALILFLLVLFGIIALA